MSCVRFPPVMEDPIIVSCGWDKVVKVWRLSTLKLKTNLVGHTGYVSTVTVSPDGSLCASGGKDKVAMLWDLNEGKRLYSLDAGSAIHALVFSPNRYWLCAATDKCIKVCERLVTVVSVTGVLAVPRVRMHAVGPIKPLCDRWCAAQIWDLESKGTVAELVPEFEERGKGALVPYCTAVSWSADGSVLYAGYTDGIIRVYGVNV